MKLYLTLLITVFSQIALAQSGWNWPTDSVQARKKASIYPELIETGNFTAAKENFDWLLENAPDLNVSLYINGVKLYDSLINKTEDKEVADMYRQKVLDLYDMRIQYFGKEETNKIRKAFSAYRLLKNEKQQLIVLDQVVSSTFNTQKKDLPESLFLIQADVMRRLHRQGLLLNSDEILSRFDTLLDLYSVNENKKEGTENKLFAILKNIVKFDCPTLENWLMPRLIASPTDTILAKRILSLSFSLECTEQDFFVQTADLLVKNAPSYGVLKMLGSKSEVKGDFKAAFDYYQKAEHYTNDKKDIYDLKIRQARINQRLNKYALAFKYAQECISIDGTDSRPFELIGDLWLSSFASCKQGKSIVEDRAVYFAAYKWYAKVGNQKKMKIASQQFPLIEEIFGELKKEGNELVIENCWAKEKVKIRRRSNVNQ